MSKLESNFQSSLIKELKKLFSGCLITKLDSGHIQGIPDLLILHGTKWAILECKRNANATHQPNQDYYVDMLNKMSFSKFIYPENKDEVINELKKFFK